MSDSRKRSPVALYSRGDVRKTPNYNERDSDEDNRRTEDEDSQLTITPSREDTINNVIFPAVEKQNPSTQIDELRESILEIEGKMDSDIRNRLRIGLSRQLQLPLAAAPADSSSESGSSSFSRFHGGSNGDSSSSSDSNIVNIDRSSVGQSPDKTVVGTTSPLFYPHKELLRFHSLEEVPNFRCRWTEAKESTKVR
jgi:hypothetical protein